MTSVFAGIDPDAYKPHALHSGERMWPETNCYIDLWIEVLSTFGVAGAAGVFAAATDAVRVRMMLKPSTEATRAR